MKWPADHIAQSLEKGFGNDERALALQLHVENLADEQPDLFIDSGNGEPTSKITSRPRTVGLSVTQAFGG